MRWLQKLEVLILMELNPNEKLSWWQKMLGFSSPVAKFVQEYEDLSLNLKQLLMSLRDISLN